MKEAPARPAPMRLLLASLLVGTLTHAESDMCIGLGKKKCLKPCRWLNKKKTCVNARKPEGECPDDIWEKCGRRKMKACQNSGNGCVWSIISKKCEPEPPCDAKEDSWDGGDSGGMDMDELRMMIEEVLDGMLEEKLPMMMEEYLKDWTPSPGSDSDGEDEDENESENGELPPCKCADVWTSTDDSLDRGVERTVIGNFCDVEQYGCEADLLCNGEQQKWCVPEDTACVPELGGNLEASEPWIYCEPEELKECECLDAWDSSDCDDSDAIQNGCTQCEADDEAWCYIKSYPCILPANAYRTDDDETWMYCDAEEIPELPELEECECADTWTSSDCDNEPQNGCTNCDESGPWCYLKDYKTRGYSEGTCAIPAGATRNDDGDWRWMYCAMEEEDEMENEMENCADLNKGRCDAVRECRWHKNRDVCIDM